MKTTHQTSHRRFASSPPYSEITSPADHAIEDRLDALRARHPGAKIEVHRIEHQPACAVHDGRACSCSDPSPVVILDGRQWLRLDRDGSTSDATPPQPRPDMLDTEDGHHQLGECLPVRDWLRTAISTHATTIIGEGESARFLGGVIDEPLTRRLARLENPQPTQP